MDQAKPEDKKMKSQDKSALGCVVVAVLLYSALPIVFSFGGASNAPFLFVAFIKLFSIFSSAVYLFYGYEEKMNQATLKIILNHLRHKTIFWTVSTHFAYVIFAFALRYVDESIAAVLIETWCIFLVIFMARFFGEEDRYEKFTTQKWFLFAVAFVGIGFIVISQISTIDNVVSELFTVASLGGVGLVLLAALLAATGFPANQLWGSYVQSQGKASENANEEEEEDQKKEKSKEEEKFYTIVASIIGQILIVPALFVLGFFFEESFQFFGSMGIAATYGFLGLGVGDTLFRIANAKTRNLGINALFYLVPAVSLIWLGLASQIDVPHIDWLIIGVIAIITANLLLNVIVEIRSAYTALIIALWLCGMAVYLHDGLPLSDYFETVGVVSTLFILILVFRADRLVRRTAEEENRVFFIYNRLSRLARKKGIDEDATNQLRDIDEHKKPEDLLTAYHTLKGYLKATRKKYPEYDDDKLDELEAAVDSLAHSKQQGANFGELIAMGVITFIMVCALLFFKPAELFSWNRLFTEVTSFLLAAVIVFLFFNIFDLQHDRTNAVLKSDKKEKIRVLYSASFDDATDRSGEQLVSVAVCIAITGAYIYLFLEKWVW